MYNLCHQNERINMLPQSKKAFASDNWAGVHPEILQALSDSNSGHVPSYGSDFYSQQAVETLKKHFGSAIDVYFVFNGTGANIIGLSSMVQPYNAIICSDVAHIHESECGGIERFAGSKLLTVPHQNGKLIIEDIKKYLHYRGKQHYVQPKVISITQPTEYGTLYTVDEIKKIADFAHENGMYLHMDGARFANAAVALNVPLRGMTTDVGVDVLSLGGTKNGMMIGEAIVFFNRELAQSAKYIRQQGMQCASKMRFIAAQFNAMFAGDLWKRNAQHSNSMAALLAKELATIKNLTITQPVEINVVFAQMPGDAIKSLQEHYYFHMWDEDISEVRLMTAWDTTEEDIKNFVAHAKTILK